MGLKRPITQLLPAGLASTLLYWLLVSCQSPSIPVDTPAKPTSPPPSPTRNWDQQRSLETKGQPLPGGYAKGDAFPSTRIGVYLKTLDALEPRQEQWEFDQITRRWRTVASDLPLRFNPVDLALYDILGNPLFFTGLGYYYRPQQEQPFDYLTDFAETVKRGRLPDYPGAKQPTRFFGLDQSIFVLEAGGQNNLWEYNDNSPSDGFRLRTKLPLTNQTEMQTFSIGLRAGYVLVEGPTVRLYQYDPITNNWTRRANFPGEGRTRGIAFSFSNQGYYGTGQATATGSGLRDIWQYDPATNSWKRVAEYPGGGQTDMVAHSLSDGVYMGLGYSISRTSIGTNAFDAQYDLWRYIPN